MNGSNKKRVVVAEAVETLKKPPYQKRVWLAARNNLILQLNWPDEITDTICNFDGHIIVNNGTHWSIPDIAKILGNELGDCCCFFDYFEKDHHEPYCEARFIDRLRLVDLYFKIKYRLIARHFNK